MTALNFACLFAALFVGHHIGGHWVGRQVAADAQHPAGLPGWLTTLTHAATYTLTCALVVELVAWRVGLELVPGRVLAGLAVAAVTHTWVGRRHTLRWRADRLRAGTLSRVASGGTNSVHLDQPWHLGWLLVAALVAA